MEAAKRIVKNTGILYIRMAITVFISLYSTRLILAALGVSDFGLFNLVGGVISMLGFLNSSMAAATQRFMSFAQGAGDQEKVKRIFNMSSLLHWGIAVLVLLLLEGAGYFFFHGILNIAPNRIEVAKLIYQFMVISTLFTVISVPYEAVITSHENMLIYAVMGVIEAVLKLGIALYITYSAMGHLVMYGILMAVLSIVLLIIKRIYCHWVYDECDLHVKQYYDKSLLKEMGGFAGWSLMGSSSNLISNYGQGVILNIFFGPIINAAQTISAQVSGQLSVLSSTLVKVINPIIDRSAGRKDFNKILLLSRLGGKISFFLLLFFYVPVLIEMPYIFKIWLKNVPRYTVIFCRLLLLRNLIEQIFIPLVSAISANGNIKKFQIYSSIIVLFPLPISYLIFSHGLPSYYLYIVYFFYSIFASCLILYFAYKYFDLELIDFIKEVILRCIGSFLMITIISFLPLFIFSEGLFRLIFVFILSSISFILIIYHLGLNKMERNFGIILATDFIRKYKI
jgi:O-antigen/teichoic acid export membrane protein